MVSVDTRGVTVECKARCWLPFPEMKILDDEGNNVAAKEPQEEQKSEGCFTVKLNVTLQNPTSRYQNILRRVCFNVGNTGAGVNVPHCQRAKADDNVSACFCSVSQITHTTDCILKTLYKVII